MNRRGLSEASYTATSRCADFIRQADVFALAVRVRVSPYAHEGRTARIAIRIQFQPAA
jgi:hypothetical protein